MKPVCGKDGKTYPNECLAKCAKVEVKSHQACTANTEVIAIWQAVIKAESQRIGTWQKQWQTTDRKPVYTATTKTIIGTAKIAYKFSFSNKCVASIFYDTSKSSATFGSGSCPTDKCVDDAQLSGLLVTKLKIAPKLVTVLMQLPHIPATGASHFCNLTSLPSLHLQLRRRSQNCS